MVRWHHQLNHHEVEQTLRDSKRTQKLGVLQPIGSQRVRYDLVTEQQQQNNTMELFFLTYKIFFLFKKCK